MKRKILIIVFAVLGLTVMSAITTWDSYPSAIDQPQSNRERFKLARAVAQRQRDARLVDCVHDDPPRWLTGRLRTDWYEWCENQTKERKRR